MTPAWHCGCDGPALFGWNVQIPEEDPLREMFEEEQREERLALRDATRELEERLARHRGAWSAVIERISGQGTPPPCFNPEPEAMAAIVLEKHSELLIQLASLNDQRQDFQRHFEAAAIESGHRRTTIERLNRELAEERARSAALAARLDEYIAKQED